MVPYLVANPSRELGCAFCFFLPAVVLVAPFPTKSFLPDGKLRGATGFQVRGMGCQRWLFLPVIPENCDMSSVGHIR